MWSLPGRTLRFRLRQGPEFELSEFEGPRRVRLVVGSFDFCLVMARRWHESGGQAPAPGGKPRPREAPPPSGRGTPRREQQSGAAGGLF